MFQLQKYFPKTYKTLHEKEYCKMQECVNSNLEKGIREGLYRSEINIDFVSRIYYANVHLIKEKNNFEEWIIWMLRGVKETAVDTLILVKEINLLIEMYQNEIKEKLPKIYSKDLVENLFKHPYTKIEFMQKDLGLTKKTVISYLSKLTDMGLLKKYKLGRNVYYMNEKLFDLFVNFKEIRKGKNYT